MFSPNPKNDPLLSAIKTVIAENDKHREAVDRANQHFKITDKRQLPHNLHAEYDALLKESNNLSEKITKSTPMGDVISDFEKSDAPQFVGKSKEKRREMAIAAKMSAMKEEIAPTPMPRRADRMPSDTGGYTVAKGDTLTKLAKTYGISIKDIADANRIRDVNKLQIGQKLVIPGKTASPADSLQYGELVKPKYDVYMRTVGVGNRLVSTPADPLAPVASSATNTTLKNRYVSTYAVDQYGNLTPRTSNKLTGPNGMTGTSGNTDASPNDPVAAAKAKAAQAGAAAVALQQQYRDRKTASDVALFRKADSQSLAGIKPSNQMLPNRTSSNPVNANGIAQNPANKPTPDTSSADLNSGVLSNWMKDTDFNQQSSYDDRIARADAQDAARYYRAFGPSTGPTGSMGGLNSTLAQFGKNNLAKGKSTSGISPNLSPKPIAVDRPVSGNISGSSGYGGNGSITLGAPNHGPNFMRDLSVAKGKSTPVASQPATYDWTGGDTAQKYISMKEELKGNQHKIDANKNNRIDAQDFKMLRKMDEDVMLEAISNLLQKDTLSESEYNAIMESAFGVAFQDARRSGNETFEFGGKMYNSRDKNETEDQWKAGLAKNKAPPVPMARRDDRMPTTSPVASQSNSGISGLSNPRPGVISINGVPIKAGRSEAPAVTAPPVSGVSGSSGYGGNGSITLGAPNHGPNFMRDYSVAKDKGIGR